MDGQRGMAFGFRKATEDVKIPDDIYFKFIKIKLARRAGSDGSMSASDSAGPEFDPRRVSKFSFENFQHRG